MQTALMAWENNNRLRAVFDRLLHTLRDFVRVYPMRDDGPMPQHDVVWETHAYAGKGGPEQVILDAIKMYPELWAPALPAECIIVRRASLAKLLSADVAGALAMDGAYIVDSHAARLRYEAERTDLCKSTT